MFCHEIEIWSKINEKENIFQAEEDFDKLQMSVITTIPESFTRQALFNDVKGISPTEPLSTCQSQGYQMPIDTTRKWLV